MATRLALYLFILAIGAFVGLKGKLKEQITSKMDTIQSLCLFFLLFIMGIRIGVDEKVLSSFFKLGYQAVILSAFSVFFSVLFVKCIKGYIVKDSKQEEATNEF
ncbi:LysO family transporter [Crassaminicella profunda]|uniref:LysO family transporter n=1 Tax=Crassaminicella profunda TaxID=1286698 RepID=UPI001CA7663E|nr:LysO family transporter [Crassaminicella profunda]QZY54174.1 LysO family transporter [Crassaminicella profunda]